MCHAALQTEPSGQGVQCLQGTGRLADTAGHLSAGMPGVIPIRQLHADLAIDPRRNSDCQMRARRQISIAAR